MIMNLNTNPLLKPTKPLYSLRSYLQFLFWKYRTSNSSSPKVNDQCVSVQSGETEGASE